MSDSVGISSLHFDEKGLIPAIVQDSETGRVIMFAWMNRESLKQSLEIGETIFFSRSRSELWHKGAISGNTQKISKIEVDCDSDSLLVTVIPAGPACHTGKVSCFDNGVLEVDK